MSSSNNNDTIENDDTDNNNDKSTKIGSTVHQQILDLLNQNNIEFRHLHHEETPTSEDSARVRGVDISTGGKALLLYLEPKKNRHTSTKA